MRLVVSADTALPIREENAGACWERVRGREVRLPAGPGRPRRMRTTHASRLGRGHCAAAAHTLSR